MRKASASSVKSDDCHCPPRKIPTPAKKPTITLSEEQIRIQHGRVSRKQKVHFANAVKRLQQRDHSLFSRDLNEMVVGNAAPNATAATQPFVRSYDMFNGGFAHPVLHGNKIAAVDPDEEEFDVDFEKIMQDVINGLLLEV